MSSLIVYTEQRDIYYEDPRSTKSVIRIDNFYYLLTAEVAEIKITDLAGNDQNLEIIINTGCFTNAGCLDNTLVIRTFPETPFTITNFGEMVNITNHSSDIKILKPNYDGNQSNLYYEESLFKIDVERLRKKGEFILIADGGDCASLKSDICCKYLESHIISKKGFRKSTYRKILKTHCVG
jgi:hypothetical protein